MMELRSRRRELLNIVKSEKKVDINDLAKRLEVSSMTIRRYLKKLSEQRIVTIVQGGAVYNEGTASMRSSSAREAVMQKEKTGIAAACANLIKEGNAIYIDAGSTCVALAECLRGRKNITVLTHSLPVLNVLAGSPDIKLFSMSGIYSDAIKAFYGELVTDNIKKFHIDIAFLGVQAVDAENGLMNPTMFDLSVKKQIIDRAHCNVLAIDNTKINKQAFVQICPIKSIHTIVTDKKADAEFVKKAIRMGIKIIQV